MSITLKMEASPNTFESVNTYVDSRKISGYTYTTTKTDDFSIDTDGAYRITYKDQFGETQVLTDDINANTITALEGSTVTMVINTDSSPYEASVNVYISEKKYKVTYTLTGCSISNRENQIALDGSLSLKVVPSSQYIVTTDDITVQNASFTYSNNILNISSPTGNVTITIKAQKVGYPVSFSLNNCEISPNIAYLMSTETKTTVITPTEGYEVKEANITCAGCSWSYAGQTLTLSNATGNVTVTVTAAEIVPISYAITYDLEKCEVTPKPSAINENSSIIYTVTPYEGYEVDTRSIDVLGASFSYTDGILTVSNPTDNVNISIVASASAPVKYNINMTCNNCTGVPILTSMYSTDSVSSEITPDTGYSVFRVDITVLNASFDWDGRTLTIFEPTGNVKIDVIAKQRTEYPITWEVTGATLSTQPETITKGYSIETVVTPNFGYFLDSSCFTVQGASFEWFSQSNILAVYDPIGEVYVNVHARILSGDEHPITFECTNCMVETPPTIIGNDDSLTVNIIANDGYKPDDFTVNIMNAQYTIIGNQLTVFSPTGDVRVFIDAIRQEYSITYHTENIIINSAPTSISLYGSVNMTYTVEEGYYIDDTCITAENATISLSADKIYISSPTGNVNASIIAKPLELTFELYQNSSEPNRVDKRNYLTRVATLKGVLRETTSITNIQISIEYHKAPDFNYIFVPNFNRYYFVKNISSIIQNIWYIDMQVDVLMSYNSAIRNLTAFVSRNEYKYNDLLLDDNIVVQSGDTLSYKAVPTQYITHKDVSYVINTYNVQLLEETEE